MKSFSYSICRKKSQAFRNAFSDYFLFLIRPVLVYDTEYPKNISSHIRVGYLWKKFSLLCLNVIFVVHIGSNYIVRAVEDTKAENRLVELFLRICLPLFLCNMSLFVIIFECLCNILAEISDYGDREFYEDWWNSTTWDEFARKWNKPVHEFLLCHVYAPLVGLKINKFDAAIATFLFSAVFHELIMGICFRTLKMHMFAIMLIQIPLIFFTEKMKETILGNLIFWAGVIIGVPILALSYAVITE
eukprot:GHVP01036343.1.p1 GENE.GHVP01036343.1~~GHVP01036343.1.p1  ORF type:complete len:245 (+),score=26.25 GHVP01036343.1:456-1190(+)